MVDTPTNYVKLYEFVSVLYWDHTRILNTATKSADFKQNSLYTNRKSKALVVEKEKKSYFLFINVAVSCTAGVMRVFLYIFCCIIENRKTE